MKSKKPAATAILPATYATWLAALKDRVRSAQLRAAAHVNQELLGLYWEIGRQIHGQQQKAGWGARIIPQLAVDLNADFPGQAGFSERNLKRMIAFFREYPGLFIAAGSKAGSAGVAQKVPQAAAQTTEPSSDTAIVPQPAAQMGNTSVTTVNVPRAAAHLPWFHHVILLEKVKDRTARAWYMQAAVEHGWSRAVLTVQIEQRAHAGAGRAVTNFASTLPPIQSDLAQQTLKDPYIFDFLTLDAAARERELEQGLTDHIQKFLVALGTGFAFVGRQVHLEIGGDDYYLDLLFYHLKLRCFVVIDLKVESFKPEFAGKMNFYLSAVDAQLRHADDQPTIGLLLCKENNHLKVEYALRDMKKPIGVAEWRTRLVESLPKKLQSSLPTVEQIERELGERK